MRTLTILLTILCLKLQAVTVAPTILRACINNDDSTVTISWTGISDACGSFSKYSLYEKIASGSYQKIADIGNILIKEHSYKLSDLNADRTYYLSVLYLCDGVDSIQSATLKIDQSAPSPPTVLDSVSFDIPTQQIVAGWTGSSASDIMGYRLYRYAGGISDSTGETSDTNYTVSTGISDVFNVTISAFDSCKLFAKISDPHRPVILSASIDSCLKLISLNWSLYQGWSQIDSQALFISRNHQNYVHEESFNGSTSSFTFTNFQMGDTICFYIRSYTGNPRISSTSNIVCIESRALIEPNFLYVRQITVENNQEIRLNFETDKTQDIQSYNLYRATNSGGYSLLDNITNTSNLSYTYLDPGVDVHSNYYNYYVVAVNSCDIEILESNRSNSILLTLDQQATFNAYNNWDGMVDNYEFQIQALSSSTWNTSTVVGSEGSIVYEDSAACYRIKANENTNSYAYAETSISNTVCIEPSLSVYVPNTIVLSGKNNRFIIVGQGIDLENSEYEIYNRWGEKMVSNRVDQAWYGNYMGEPVLPGIYVYIIKVRGLKGESETHKGVLRIIE